jgi:hypothetical protein
MSSALNLSKFKLDQYIGTVFSTLRPNQDKRNTTCRKLKLPSGILPEEYQDYCNKSYGYSDYYCLWITHLDYHYSRNKTWLPVIRSLYSQRTLFQVTFSYIERVNSYTEHFTKKEVPRIIYLIKSTTVRHRYIDFVFCLSTLKEDFQETGYYEWI